MGIGCLPTCFLGGSRSWWATLGVFEKPRKEKKNCPLFFFLKSAEDSETLIPIGRHLYQNRCPKKLNLACPNKIFLPKWGVVGGSRHRQRHCQHLRSGKSFAGGRCLTSRPQTVLWGRRNLTHRL